MNANFSFKNVRAYMTAPDGSKFNLVAKESKIPTVGDRVRFLGTLLVGTLRVLTKDNIAHVEWEGRRQGPVLCSLERLGKETL